MEVNVLLFGQIVDIIGKSSIKVDDVEDTNALVQKLQSMYPALANSKYAVAVNKKIINSNTLLQQGEEVAILPPFSGG